MPHIPIYFTQTTYSYIFDTNCTTKYHRILNMMSSCQTYFSASGFLFRRTCTYFFLLLLQLQLACCLFLSSLFLIGVDTFGQSEETTSPLPPPGCKNVGQGQIRTFPLCKYVVQLHPLTPPPFPTYQPLLPS